jgi:hypothetical protein
MEPLSIQSIYAIRALSRAPLPKNIQDTISTLKSSFKPAFRRPAYYPKNIKKETTNLDNWRENALANFVKTVREKGDPDYEQINGKINKLTKQTYTKLVADIIETMDSRDPMFRLRVTTLLFDRGIQQNFYASLMADAYADIIKKWEDARQDLLTQVNMFDTLYDVKNVSVVIPSINDPGYDAAIIAWTKQKETKRSFAVYVSELYARGLIPSETMNRFVSTVCTDLLDSIVFPRTDANEEHVDNLVRFVGAVAGKVVIRDNITSMLAISKAHTPSLSMKSRFKLEDALKIAQR